MRRSTQHRSVRPVRDKTGIVFSHRKRDLSRVEPDELRAQIYSALASLPADRRAAIRDEVLGLIESLGFDLGSCLLILGIPAETADDLTPLDIAKLTRYVRMNGPSLVPVLTGSLAELLRREGLDLSVQAPSRKALHDRLRWGLLSSEPVKNDACRLEARSTLPAFVPTRASSLKASRRSEAGYI